MILPNSTNVTNTISSQDYNKLIPYVCVGSVSLAVNLLTLAILFKNGKLFKKSAVIVGIVAANLSVSLHILTFGAYRLSNLSSLNSSIPAIVCLTTVIPLLHPVCYVSEGVFIFIGGVERALAINAPVWFHKTWKNKFAWKMVGIGCIPAIIFAVTGICISAYMPSTTRYCGSSDVFGEKFVQACRSMSILGGALGAGLTVFALTTGLRKFRKLPLSSTDVNRLKRQLRLTKSMLLASVSDLLLVSVPNTLIMIGPMSSNDWFKDFAGGLNANYAFCANATAMFIALILFNREFRQAASTLACGYKVAPP